MWLNGEPARRLVHFEHVVNSIPLFLFLAPCYLFCNGLMDHLCLCANLGSPFRPFPHTPHPPFNSTLVCLFFLGCRAVSHLRPVRLFCAAMYSIYFKNILYNIVFFFSYGGVQYKKIKIYKGNVYRVFLLFHCNLVCSKHSVPCVCSVLTGPLPCLVVGISPKIEMLHLRPSKC